MNSFNIVSFKIYLYNSISFHKNERVNVSASLLFLKVVLRAYLCKDRDIFYNDSFEQLKFNFFRVCLLFLENKQLVYFLLLHN